MDSISGFVALRNSSNLLFNGNKLVLRKRITVDSHTKLEIFPKASRGTAAIVSALHFARREILFATIGILVGSLRKGREDEVAVASDFADMPALRGKDYGKTKMRYPDYSETKSGLQYKDLRVGSGPLPKIGETVVIDWDGYTIGYLVRIFEARNKAKGGPFEGGDKEFFKFKLGSQQVIPAFEEAVAGMSSGGIRR